MKKATLNALMWFNNVVFSLLHTANKIDMQATPDKNEAKYKRIKCCEKSYMVRNLVFLFLLYVKYTTRAGAVQGSAGT
jgi:TRAP-type uncharacterized transport system fused permease subunit